MGNLGAFALGETHERPQCLDELGRELLHEAVFSSAHRDILSGSMDSTLRARKNGLAMPADGLGPPTQDSWLDLARWIGRSAMSMSVRCILTKSAVSHDPHEAWANWDEPYRTTYTMHAAQSAEQALDAV